MPVESEGSAFPELTLSEIELLRTLGESVEFGDGAVIFRAGDAELDLFVVEAGAIEIRNPADHDSIVTTHVPGEFAGDIDLLTGRPVIVVGIARGATRLLRVPHSRLRAVLNIVPSFGEKLIVAVEARRAALARTGKLGLLVVGPRHCKNTNLLREFLYKNFVPFTWVDSDTTEGASVPAVHEPGCPTPVVTLGAGRVLKNPSLHQLARAAGVWRPCPTETVDVAVVGAGPAGISASVYAASEGLSTLLIDRLGPGGQAGGSSKIENFIGFPAGLSGAELATRGVLQMLKFGARMLAPATVDRLEVSADRGEPHSLLLDSGDRVQAKVVLVATGVHWRRLPGKNADRFEGAGVHYVCTAIEAVLYDQFDVAIVGAGNSAGQAAVYMAECCRNRRVHLLVRGRLGPSMSEYLLSRIRDLANVTVHEGTEIEELGGGARLEWIQLAGESTDAPKRLGVAGVFVFIGADPTAGWLPPGLARDDLGYILTGSDAAQSGRWPLEGRLPCPLETTIPGVLAAGDIRSGSTKRVGFAVGDGSLAVTCVHRLISGDRRIDKPRQPATFTFERPDPSNIDSRVEPGSVTRASPV